MNSFSSVIKINSIIYDTQDAEVLIQAEQRKNHLSFESKFFVSFSELNSLLNKLQKLNPELIVSDLFIEEKLDENFTQFHLNAALLANSIITLDKFFSETTKRQIRA